jgi:hypothetical protein
LEGLVQEVMHFLSKTLSILFQTKFSALTAKDSLEILDRSNSELNQTFDSTANAQAQTMCACQSIVFLQKKTKTVGPMFTTDAHTKPTCYEYM